MQIGHRWAGQNRTRVPSLGEIDIETFGIPIFHTWNILIDLHDVALDYFDNT